MQQGRAGPPPMSTHRRGWPHHRRRHRRTAAPMQCMQPATRMPPAVVALPEHRLTSQTTQAVPRLRKSPGRAYIWSGRPSSGPLAMLHSCDCRGLWACGVHTSGRWQAMCSGAGTGMGPSAALGSWHNCTRPPAPTARPAPIACQWIQARPVGMGEARHEGRHSQHMGSSVALPPWRPGGHVR